MTPTLEQSVTAWTAIDGALHKLAKTLEPRIIDDATEKHVRTAIAALVDAKRCINESQQHRKKPA